MNTHQKGYTAEALVSLLATRADWIVSKPEVEARYDLVLDDGKSLYRVQVKYANRVKNNALSIDFRKECRNNGKIKVYTKSEIDAIIIYCPALPTLLWLPCSAFDGLKSMTLRFSETKNKQKKGVRLAEQFQWLRNSIVE